ncbi:glycoside hydrolase family 53 protein [Portibacter marinus]|uniref:glycoside hydrolase family 53 protein n=1 Tax=Portibacter marinus TaxID=2898660 RepID=UPI001F20BE06|nr:glycosyl hydrolase 53 family protein [Portibacter marinus]
MFCIFGQAQEFYYGADQSYVNEMEDCGVVYKENGETKDVYDIFQDYGSNLVRLRLWHTPEWYDQLNDGKRYSDLQDVKKSIQRAKEHDMSVLLDFHLSDEWADPGKQIIPKAWEGVANDLEVLKDSLYNYIYSTLSSLHNDGLLPDMVQVGNETNKGILQTKEDNQEWKLEWPRNAELFNHGIKAVRDIARDLGKEIQVMVHFAGPEDAIWLMEQFWSNGVQDFDIIGLSYYWAWHKPTTIKRAGDIIDMFRTKYDKEVMVVETGYIWTTASNDSANNIISEIDENYGAASPASQKAWLIDLKNEVQNSGGLGMIYWEPSWVSSECRTLWGKGSHQEHATFFDFNSNLLIPGGVEWMKENSVSIEEKVVGTSIQISYDTINHNLVVSLPSEPRDSYAYRITDLTGRLLLQGRISSQLQYIPIDLKQPQYVVISINEGNQLLKTLKQFISSH